MKMWASNSDANSMEWLPERVCEAWKVLDAENVPKMLHRQLAVRASGLEISPRLRFLPSMYLIWYMYLIGYIVRDPVPLHLLI